MLLHTPRLILRNFNDSDLEPFLAYRNDPYVAKYQGWSIPYPRESGEAFIREVRDIHAPKQGQWMQIAIALKENNKLIGDIGCLVKQEDARQATIGYRLDSGVWRKGYAFEAIHCWLGYLFEDLNMHRVVADCDTENTASYRLLEKLGFRREAHFIESYLENGAYTNEYHYGLLQREWRARVPGAH
jgi:RimJ/RimL family protein N-acetyltransferase